MPSLSVRRRAACAGWEEPAGYTAPAAFNKDKLPGGANICARG
jgi:hypothetical protein